MYTCIHCICKVLTSLFVLVSLLHLCLAPLLPLLPKVRFTPLGSQSSSAGTEKLTKGWLVGDVVLVRGHR
jgi:hypothetical protein